MERLLELLAIELREQLVTQVETQVATGVQTHVSTQASTQLRIPLLVLPGELLRVLLDEYQRDVLARNLAVQTDYLVRVISRSSGQSEQAFWTGYWFAAGS